jgi:hypothetical protein
MVGKIWWCGVYVVTEAAVLKECTNGRRIPEHCASHKQERRVAKREEGSTRERERGGGGIREDGLQNSMFVTGTVLQTDIGPYVSSEDGNEFTASTMVPSVRHRYSPQSVFKKKHQTSNTGPLNQLNLK